MRPPLNAHAPSRFSSPQALKVSQAVSSSSAAPQAGKASAADALDDATDGGLRLDGRSRMALMARLAGQDVSAVPAAINPATGLPWVGPLPGPPQVAAAPNAALATAQGVLGPASPIPTDCLLLKNLFNPDEETEDNWRVPPLR